MSDRNFRASDENRQRHRISSDKGAQSHKCVGTVRKGPNKGQPCPNWAMAGYATCKNHGGLGADVDNVTHGRRANLAKTFGRRFEALMNDANAIKDFDVDNALFLQREEEMTKRLPEGDSIRFRQVAKGMVESLIRAWNDDDHEAAVRWMGQLQEHMETAVDSDAVWEYILQNSERRVKVATAALQALAKEQHSITFKDIVVLMGRMLDIAVAEAGEDAAARVAYRFQHEIGGVISSLAAGSGSTTTSETERSGALPN